MEYTELDVEKIMINNPETTEIVVPEGITEIGKNAFAPAKEKIERVVLPSSLIKICDNAFNNCQKLTEVNFPPKLEEIGYQAFYNTAITSFELPEGFKKLSGSYAFAYCNNIEKVTLPSTIKTINCAFNYCKNLKEINIPPSLADDLFNFSYCSSLEKVSLPENITCIPKNAFFECKSLKDIKIPSGVTRIDTFAFRKCPLSHIDLPEGLIEVESGAFSACGLKEIKLPSTLKKIGIDTFAENKIESVTFPEEILSIGGFSENPLKKVEIPEGVNTLGYKCFENCKELEEIKLPKKLNYIDAKIPSFSGYEKTQRFGGIEGDAFFGCEKLTSIQLPENLECISSNLLTGCKSLKSIKIPETVTQINREAFRNCTSLEEIEIPQNVLMVESGILAGSGVKKVVFLAKAENENTGNALGNMEKAEEVCINSDIISEGTFAFTPDHSGTKNCPFLKKLIIGKDVKKIEDGALWGLDSLSEIVVSPENKNYAVDSGGLYAKGTKRLIRAVPVEVKNGKAFYKITDKVKAIGAFAFPHSVEEAEVEFTGKIEKISDKAVEGYYKSRWIDNNSPENAKGGAKTVYDAMTFAKAKEEKIETMKKLSADALISIALKNWKYGYEEGIGYSPARKIYRVKLPYDAAFVINLEKTPTQKSIKAVSEAISTLKTITDEAELFQKVRDLSETSPISVAGTNSTYLFDFAGFNLSTQEIAKSSQGLPPESFVKKDIESFFKGSGLEHQILSKARITSDGTRLFPGAEVAVKKDGKILSISFHSWKIFAKKNNSTSDYDSPRTILSAIIAKIKANDLETVKKFFDKKKNFPSDSRIYVISC